MYGDLTDLNSIWQMSRRSLAGERCGRATLWMLPFNIDQGLWQGAAARQVGKQAGRRAGGQLI